MFKIKWIDGKGAAFDIGGAPMFAPTDDIREAERYVVFQMWAQIHRSHPQLAGFALIDMPSQDEVFRWKCPPGCATPKR